MSVSLSYEVSPRERVLSAAASATGLVSLALAGLLPWPALAGLAGVHFAVVARPRRMEFLGTGTAMVLLGVLSAAEIGRVYAQGSQALIPAIRDLIVAVGLVRLLMRKTPREIHQILLIAVSEVIFSTIFTTSPLFLLGVGLSALLVPMTLDALDERAFSHTSTAPRSPLRHWSAVFMGMVCWTCVLFYVLPRPASSIIRHSLVDERNRAFREEVDLRNATSEADEAILMRIVWNVGKRPDSFYLAGARLDRPTPHGFLREMERYGTDTGACGACENGWTDHVTVYQTDLTSEVVFHPFTLCRVAPGGIVHRGTNVLWGTRERPVRYDLWVTRRRDGTPGGGTYLPPELASVAETGRTVAGHGPPAIKVRRIIQYLRSTCAYSQAAVAPPAGEAGIAWFVLAGRKGDCEHFASALAAMIRGAGIPARVVSGFFVSEFNEAGSYFIVRSKDAHAWVEYYDGSWHTADATPPGAVAQERYLSHAVDTLRFAWVRWVIEYSLDDQVAFALKALSVTRAWGREGVRLPGKAMVLALIGALCVLTVMGGVYRLRASPYERVLRAFRRKGLVMPKNLPHERHLEEVVSFDEALAGAFGGYLDAYLAWRFGCKEGDIHTLTRDMVRAVRRHTRDRIP